MMMMFGFNGRSAAKIGSVKHPQQPANKTIARVNSSTGLNSTKWVKYRPTVVPQTGVVPQAGVELMAGVESSTGTHVKIFRICC